jgi:biopolymer transport protein ExbD
MAGGANEDNPVAINVVAMVDIIFCLCLFFMCSLKFRPLDAKLDSWLPRTGGPPDVAEAAPPQLDEIRVLMSWNSEMNRVERIFGQTHAVPATPEGDASLRDLIAAQAAAFRARGRSDVPVTIDAGPLVPWTNVVDVLDLARDAGAHRIEFAWGSETR